jgi:hypothetical protein
MFCRTHGTNRCGVAVECAIESRQGPDNRDRTALNSSMWRGADMRKVQEISVSFFSRMVLG